MSFRYELSALSALGYAFLLYGVSSPLIWQCDLPPFGYHPKVANISNPEAFNYEAGIILSELYGVFPNPADWVLDEDTEMYPTETGHNRAQIQEESLVWLQQHGFLETSGKVGGKFLMVQLTPVGLEALRKIPNALGKSEPMIELIKKKIAQKSVAGVGLLMGLMVKQFLGIPQT